MPAEARTLRRASSCDSPKLVCEHGGIGAYLRIEGHRLHGRLRPEGVLMQTEHYMANMGKPGRAERLSVVGIVRVDDLAGRELRQVNAALGMAPRRSAGASAGGGAAAPRRGGSEPPAALAGNA
jgi:hypothetical protein